MLKTTYIGKKLQCCGFPLSLYMYNKNSHYAFYDLTFSGFLFQFDSYPLFTLKVTSSPTPMLRYSHGFKSGRWNNVPSYDGSLFSKTVCDASFQRRRMIPDILRLLLFWMYVYIRMHAKDAPPHTHSLLRPPPPPHARSSASPPSLSSYVFFQIDVCITHYYDTNYYAMAWRMALSADPALNHVIWFSLKVWFTGKEYEDPSGFVPWNVSCFPGVGGNPTMLTLSAGPTLS